MPVKVKNQSSTSLAHTMPFVLLSITLCWNNEHDEVRKVKRKRYVWKGRTKQKRLVASECLRGRFTPVKRWSGRLGTSQPTSPWPETPASNHVPCEHGWAGSVRSAMPPGQGCHATDILAVAAYRHDLDFFLKTRKRSWFIPRNLTKRSVTCAKHLWTRSYGDRHREIQNRFCVGLQLENIRIFFKKIRISDTLLAFGMLI